jgi:hypothetical protein
MDPRRLGLDLRLLAPYHDKCQMEFRWSIGSFDDVTGDLALGHCERLSLGSQIIPARSAATAATPIAGSASESKKTIRAILATKIQKLIPTERIPRCDG